MTFCWKYAQCTSVTHRASTSCSFIHIFFQIISKWSFVNRHNFNRLGYLFVFVVVSPVQFSNFVVFSLHIRSSTSLCRCINLVRPPIRVTSDPVISITWPQYANLSFSRNLRKTWDCALNLHPFYQFRVCKNVKSTKQVDRVFVVVVVRVCFFFILLLSVQSIVPLWLLLLFLIGLRLRFRRSEWAMHAKQNCAWASRNRQKGRGNVITRIVDIRAPIPVCVCAYASYFFLPCIRMVGHRNVAAR